MVDVLPDAPMLAAAAGDFIADTIRRVLVRRGRCVVALSGGSTPVETYRSLALRHKASVPWDFVQFIWGDERMVPSDHPDSNYGMARRELLGPLEVPDENILRVPTEVESVEEAAREYQRRLVESAPADNGPDLPRLDLVLLGLGEDGHTASLIPGCPAVEATERWVAPCEVEGIAHPRVTLTLPVLNAAAMVLFLVTGQRKAAVLGRVLQEVPPLAPILPAQRVRPADGELRWMVDESAAGALDREGHG